MPYAVLIFFLGRLGSTSANDNNDNKKGQGNFFFLKKKEVKKNATRFCYFPSYGRNENS